MEVPQNEVVTSKMMLEKYLEKHPEDTLKWTEFFAPAEDTFHRRHKRTVTGFLQALAPTVEHEEEDSDSENNDVFDRQEAHALPEVNTEVIANDWILNQGTDAMEYTEGTCPYCANGYKEDQPTMTLLCGHKCHTRCYCIRTCIEQDTYVSCNVRGCRLISVRHVSREQEKIEESKDDVTTVLIDSLKKRKDFRQDIKNLKVHFSDITKGDTLIKSEMAHAKKAIVEKYQDSLNAIQVEMGKSMEEVRNGETAALYRKAVSIARKATKEFYRKYHISLRDLMNKNLIRVGWHVRWTVEHRRTYRYISNWRHRIVIRPGNGMFGKLGKSRLAREIARASDSDEEDKENAV
jgi:hypothetical protein